MDTVDDDDLDLEPRRFESYRAPEVLAPAGFAIAVAALLGYGLLSGTILLVLTAGDNGQQGMGSQVATGLLGAALAAIPLLMGLEAVRNLLEDDPLWVRGLARATVLLGGFVVLLRLLHTAAVAVADNSQYFGY